MMARFGVAVVAMAGLCALARPAQARVDIRIDLASQTMRVDAASGSYLWPISSARLGYRTDALRFPGALAEDLASGRRTRQVLERIRRLRATRSA